MVFIVFAIFGVMWVVGMVSSGAGHFKPSLSAAIDPASATVDLDDPNARHESGLRFGPQVHPPGNDGQPDTLTPNW